MTAIAADTSANGIQNEILEVNLSYLLLAQRLAREDVTMAMSRLGMGRDLVELLDSMTLPQMMGLAASSQLLCRFRFDDHTILSALIEHNRDQTLRQAHTAVLMAAQAPEQLN